MYNPSDNQDVNHALSDRLDLNEQQIRDIFKDCADLQFYHWSYGSELQFSALAVYIETLVQEDMVINITNGLLSPLNIQLTSNLPQETREVGAFWDRYGQSGHARTQLQYMSELVQEILEGHLVILFNHWHYALSCDISNINQRQISEPITEPVVQGPHLSTIEELDVNISLIRRLLKTPELKFSDVTSGKSTKRQITYGYLNGAVNPETLSKFKECITSIDSEEILETSYIEEWIKQSSFSPFPLTRYTERPDTAVAALLDGKIIVLVQGSPSIMICPGLFVEFFMSSEDYYHSTLFATLIRILRVGAALIALLLPSLYIALSTFHSELLPTVLLLAILDSREGIPFPAILEALIMEFFFELLREAGIRLPRPIGSAVSIVGALVIGQAAIQARIASPVMVIVVALTGIASFALPQYNMAIAIRILRFPLMFLAATLGGLGVMLGLLLSFIHVSTLRPLGQPYLTPLAPLHFRQLRDVFIVAPRKTLLRRPRNHHLHRKKG